MLSAFDLATTAWLFGALAFWPIARAIDGSCPALRPLLWAFGTQAGAQLLWGIWIAVLWIHGASHIEHGLILLIIVGSLGWVASPLAFAYWIVKRRRLPLAHGATDERVT